MMPRSLTGRIVGAFAVLAVILWLAIGATMFVALRALHAEATSSSLADIAQTFAVRLRGAVVDRDVRQVIAQIRDEVSSRVVTVHLLPPTDPWSMSARPTPRRISRSRSRRQRGSATP